MVKLLSANSNVVNLHDPTLIIRTKFAGTIDLRLEQLLKTIENHHSIVMKGLTLVIPSLKSDSHLKLKSWNVEIYCWLLIQNLNFPNIFVIFIDLLHNEQRRKKLSLREAEQQEEEH